MVWRIALELTQFCYIGGVGWNYRSLNLHNSLTLVV